MSADEIPLEPITYEQAIEVVKAKIHAMSCADRAKTLQKLVAGICVGCGFGRLACQCDGSEGCSPYSMPEDMLSKSYTNTEIE